MPVNALNAALIGAVLENTPKNSNPAATVAEILNIGREAAYRRMRGEVPFTFGEAALVAARLSFSLDRIMGTDDPDCVLFRLDFSDGQTLLEDYPGKVESWIGKMEEIASDEQSEFSLAGSSLPAALYLGYEGLVRFRFFKCFFQHGMLDGANNRFDDMQLPPHVFDLSRRLRQAVRQIDTTYYVLDHSCFKHWVNAIRSFRAMRLISEGCVRELREELLPLGALRMARDLTGVAVVGEEERLREIEQRRPELVFDLRAARRVLDVLLGQTLAQARAAVIDVNDRGEPLRRARRVHLGGATERGHQPGLRGQRIVRGEGGEPALGGPCVRERILVVFAETEHRVRGRAGDRWR